MFIGLGVARMTSADIRRASGAPKDVRSGVAVSAGLTLLLTGRRRSLFFGVPLTTSFLVCRLRCNTLTEVPHLHLSAYRCVKT